MKTTKFVLVLTFVAFATMIFAHTGNTTQEKPVPIQRCIKISFEKAMHNNQLVKAMQQQISLKILQNDFRMYTARVNFRRNVYFISGSYYQWSIFFIRDLDEDPETGTPEPNQKPVRLTK